MMEKDIVVFFVNNWKMDDGAVGCTVNFFFLDENGHIPCIDAGTKGAAGYQRAKASIDVLERASFRTVPGRYTGGFEMAVGSDGKPVLKLVSILGYKNPMYMTDVDPAGGDTIVTGKSK